MAASANRSFEGTSADVMLITRFPGTLSTLPAWMWYVVPDVTGTTMAESTPRPVSSLQSIIVSALRALPVYAVSEVS